MCVLIFFYNLCPKRFSFYEELTEVWPKMYIDLHVTYPLFLSDFNGTWIFSRQIFEKFSNIKFHENPSSGSRVVPCGRIDGRTDMTKLIVAFRNFAERA